MFTLRGGGYSELILGVSQHLTLATVALAAASRNPR